MVVFSRGLDSIKHKREVVPHEGGLKTIRDSNEQEQDWKFKKAEEGGSKGK